MTYPLVLLVQCAPCAITKPVLSASIFKLRAHEGECYDEKKSTY